MLVFLWVVLSMAFKDAFGTVMIVAEARGQDNLAGLCDSAGDAANFFLTVFGAGVAVKNGVNGHALAILAVMCVTSYIGTRFWTRMSRKIKVVEA